MSCVDSSRSGEGISPWATWQGGLHKRRDLTWLHNRSLNPDRATDSGWEAQNYPRAAARSSSIICSPVPSHSAFKCGKGIPI